MVDDGWTWGAGGRGFGEDAGLPIGNEPVEDEGEAGEIGLEQQEDRSEVTVPGGAIGELVAETGEGLGEGVGRARGGGF